MAFKYNTINAWKKRQKHYAILKFLEKIIMYSFKNRNSDITYSIDWNQYNILNLMTILIGSKINNSNKFQITSN